jgi:hypothetical protein
MFKLSLFARVQTGCSAHPVACLVRTVAPSPELKRLGSEAHSSPPSSVQIHNQWSFTFFTLHAFGACIVSNLPLPYDRNPDNHKNN